MSEALFGKFTTPNGAEVEITDLTQPYGYQDVFWVRLEVMVNYPLNEGTETYRRTLEKMGVRAEDLEAAREELVASFRETVLPYLSRPDFGEKLKNAREREKPAAVGYGK